MVDIGSLLLLMSIFGAKIAFAYVIIGLVIAVIGGTLIEKLHMEKYVEDFYNKMRAMWILTLLHLHEKIEYNTQKIK